MNSFKVRTNYLLSTILLVLSFRYPAYALPGDLDNKFGVSGTVITDIATNSLSQSANGIAIQTDGKIVLVGNFPRSDGTGEVARYNPSGSLDTTFGLNGIVTNASKNHNAVAIQTDGKIVVAGNDGASSAWVLSRHNTNGTLDTTFGTGGRVTTRFFIDHQDAEAVAIQADGKIVVAGSVGVSTGLTVARYTPAGILDTTFGSGGTIKATAGSSSAGILILASLAIQSDGKILIAAKNNGCFGLERFLSTGARDPQFGVEGAVRTCFSVSTTNSAIRTSFITAIAIRQTDGRIVAAGQVTKPLTDSGARNLALARYNPDGSLDAAFGNMGLVEKDLSSSSFGAFGVAIQADGKIVVASTEDFNLQHIPKLMTITRYDSKGILDASFGANGKVSTGFNAGSGEARAMAIQKNDGRIVVAGSGGATSTSITSLHQSVALARYHAFECGGTNVTMLATTAFLNGTDGNDVILGLGVTRNINGLGGDDILCGGGGSQEIQGGDGNDTLYGGEGSDKLGGGNGTDICVDSDKVNNGFDSCETVNIGGSGVSGAWNDVSQHCNQSAQNPQCRLKGAIEVFNPKTETTAVPSVTGFYLSSDEIWDENDTFLKTARVGVLEGGASQTIKFNVTLDGAQDLSGLYVIAVVDLYDAVPEANEANNIVVSSPLR